jgi:hypothetical protein
MSSVDPAWTGRLAQAQLDAYNRGDIEAFAACYAPDVRVWDLHDGTLRFQGRDVLHETYGRLFAEHPNLHARLDARVVVGATAADRESVTGLRDGQVVEALAIYEVRDRLIQQVWFARG